MKGYTKIIFILILLFFFPQLKTKGSLLYISENTNFVSRDNLIDQYSDSEIKSLYSTKKLGSIVENGKTVFRIFAPNPAKVELVLFENVNDNNGESFEMVRDSHAVWECTIDKDLTNKFYGYLIYSRDNIINGSSPNYAVDPYSKAVATYTDYFNPRKSIVFNKEYDWGSDSWIQRDWRDLIIYEMHIRDLTAHPSSNANSRGTYQGLIEKDQTGGLEYIKSLGINTVELLPSQEYGYIEIPYKDSLNGKFNTWNPYERNHWGYMTSNYFAPAAYYAEENDRLKRNKWIGTAGDQVKHFKDMVKAFHQEEIAVIMDVVYNHLSEYEIDNLKQIDKEYYFRLDSSGNYISESYCGNDLKTEHPMVRKLIIDSILYWMNEYHIDGFRFDLGKLIDWETIEEIIREAKKINPHAVFVCEPWGGGYDPKGFSLREWGSWNDQIRNGIKGENPNNGLGWIFGHWYDNNNAQRINSYVRGTLIKEEFGLFQKSKHSVNYLESHDGYTLSDFIRIGLGKVKPDEKIKDIEKHIKLIPDELKLNKLAAMFLFTSQGITMIHEGQEFARSKIIHEQEGIEDTHVWTIDHNSYNKDNETNYLNFNHAEINSELLNYYRGLIKLRKKHEAFRRAQYDNYTFVNQKQNPFALAYSLKYRNYEYFVVFNANPNSNFSVELPEGWWGIIADKDFGLRTVNKSIKGKLTLEPSTGIILQKK